MVQKNNREAELIVRECIWNSIRENIPIEQLLKAYIEESVEEVEKEEPKPQVPIVEKEKSREIH